MATAEQIIHVLIVDDQEIVRRGVAHTLEPYSHIMVSAAVDSAEAAYQWLHEQQVDVVILDIMLPGQSGIEACEHLKESHPDIRILMLSTLNDTQTALNTLNAGADGYMTKDCLATELATAVTAIHQGEHFLQSSIARKLAAHPDDFDDVSSPFDELSAREMDVAMLLIDGYSPAGISEHLSIDVSTVHSHRTRILEKLKVANTIKLSHLAIKYGELEISICANISQAVH